MSFYELAILGSPTAEERALLIATIGEMVREFGLALDSDVLVHDGASITGRDKHVAFAAVYFGGNEKLDLEAAQDALRSSAPVIPSVGPDIEFAAVIPDFLQGANGLRRRADDHS